jgi:putative transposase
MELAIVPPLRHAFRPENAPDPLRELLAAAVEQSAVDMLDPERLLALAEDMRIARRKRVHHAGLIIDSLILSALQRSTDTEGRWLDAQRVYEALGGKRSGETSFRNQVRKLRPVMHRLLRRRLSALAARATDDKLRGRLKHFRDVLIADGCAFKVASALSGVYSGTGTDAELKLHAVYSVGAGGCISVERSAGSVHDSDGLHPERWEAGALYIWDLGYNSYERIVEAVQAEAYVLQRLKADANPIALASYGPTGARRELRQEDGRPMRLEDACAFGFVHQQRVLDLDVRIDNAGHSVVVRVVCMPFGGQDRYYLTTLPRSIFTAHDVAELYRVRWEVERFFRGWRGALRLDEVRRLQNADSLDAAVTASLLAAALAHDLTEIVNNLAEREAAAASQAATPPCGSN